MKAKYIILSLIASLAVLVGCEKELPHYLSEVTVSSSFVSIPLDGGRTPITLDAASAWEITDIPAWLTVSPTSGTAGQSTVTFSAASVMDGRTTEIHLNCGGKVQNINVIQGVSVVSEVSCAEVIAGPESKTYRVTGVCTAIANTTYGNWYLNDGTGEIYIYGTLDSKGAEKNFLSWGLEVGDEVTVEGPKTLYNDTVELVNVTVVKINKSLIKVEEMDPEDGSIPTEGGEVTVTLANKGTGLYVDVPEEAKSWLSISSVAGNSVTFSAKENLAGPRDAILTFRTTDGSKMYSAQASVMQFGSTGSLALPFTVEEAIEYVTKLGGETAKDFYVKGIVSKIAENGEFGSYGNATFWISSDGVYNNDLTKDFEAYRVLWLDNKNWVEGNAQIAVGAEVILLGRLTVYKGTAETSGNKAFVYQINGVSSEAEGIGTLATPFTTEGAIAAAAAAPASNVYVSGIVSQIAKNGQFNAEYGNASFWISSDGVYNNDLTKDFEAFRVLYLGNRKWVAGDSEIAVGDKVTLCGPLTTYNGTSETVANKAYIYSLNGKTE